MKIVKWITYFVVGITLNMFVNSMLIKVLKLEEKKEAVDAELY